MDKKELSGKLNGILEKTIQAEIGYYKIAKKTAHSSLEAISQLKSTERNRYTIELKKCFLKINAVPLYGSNSSLEASTRWLEPKTILAIVDFKMAIDGIIKGERKTILDYEELLLLKNLPSSLKLILQSQVVTIVEGIQVLELAKVNA